MSATKDTFGTKAAERAAAEAGALAVNNELEATLQHGRAGTAGQRPRHAAGPRIDCEQVIATLRAHEPELRARGVLHVAPFGSLARGEAGPGSDIDIMLDIAPEREMGLWEYASIEEFLSSLFSTPVDVSERKALKPLIRPKAERDAVYAF